MNTPVSKTVIVRFIRVAVIAAAAVIAGASTFNAKALAETPNSSAAARSDSTPARKNFLTAIEEHNQRFNAMRESVTKLLGALNDTSNLTRDAKRADISAFRENLLSFGQTMQPDGALQQAINTFEAWIVAQTARLNNSREELGNQNVENLMATYNNYRAELGRAREMITTDSQTISQALANLRAAETLAAEFLLVDEAGKAVAALREMAKQIHDAVDQLNATIHAFGLNGRGS